MSPSEQAVLEDTLRSVRVDGQALGEEAIARMVRAVDGRIEAAVVDFMTINDNPDWADDHDPDEGTDLARMRREFDDAMNELREVACIVAYPRLGRAEKTEGGYPPHPAAPPVAAQEPRPEIPHPQTWRCLGNRGMERCGRPARHEGACEFGARSIAGERSGG